MTLLTEIGDFVVQERRNGVGDLTSLWAIHVDPVTVISPKMLSDVMQGRLQGMTVVGDLLVCEFANGAWTFKLGEYHGDTRGIVLRLLEGDPIRTERHR